MSLRICICCGEPMAERANTLSRNPNMCASCSSLADGMKESGLHSPPAPTASNRALASAPQEEVASPPEPVIIGSEPAKAQGEEKVDA